MALIAFGPCHLQSRVTAPICISAHQNARTRHDVKSREFRASRRSRNGRPMHENCPIKKDRGRGGGPRKGRRGDRRRVGGPDPQMPPCDRVTASWSRSWRAAGTRPPRQRQAAVGPLSAPTDSPYTAFAASRPRGSSVRDNGTPDGTTGR